MRRSLGAPMFLPDTAIAPKEVCYRGSGCTRYTGVLRSQDGLGVFPVAKPMLLRLQGWTKGLRPWQKPASC